MLAGQEALLDIFPGDDPLCRDFPAALAALQAYCGGEDAEMERQLKAIPFRSPFRDFRQILKALSLLDRDATGAEGLLDRIDAGSPFHPLSRTIKASQSPGPEFLLRYQGMGTAERRFVTTLKGWSAEQLRLAQELYQLGERPNVDRLLRFLLRNKEILGGEYVRGIAMRILVSYPRGKATYSKSLGRLSRFHQDRIAALRMEADAPPGEIFNAWSDLCLILNEQELPQDPESTLSEALILRRMTRQWLRSGPANPPALEALESALRCDPDDQPGYLELIRLYRGKGKLKDARRLLDEALSRYPEDTEVLTEAVETAIASRAFKKAARYARRALELDPINPRVRDILLNSHLAHARKQIRQKKIPLARREIEEAANWARTEEAQGRIALTRGMLELSDHDRAAAQSCFLSGFERTGGGLVGRFQLLMEAARMGRPMATVLKQARLPRPPRKPTRKQVLALIHALGESVDEDEGTLFEAVAFMEGPLKSAARLDFSLTEMERLCEAWLRLELSELRIPYARAALKRWPDTPVIVFHLIEAIREETFNPIPFEDREWLEEASERANAEGDTRTAHRISELLSEGLPYSEPDDEPFDPFGFDGGPGGLPNVGRIIDMIMGNREAGESESERVDRQVGEI